MYKIESGVVYRQEVGEEYEVWSAFGAEYRAVVRNNVQSWERFDLVAEGYVPAPEYTEPFPADPIRSPSPEDRITQLESENTTLKERQSITESALNDLIDITLGGGL